MKLATLLFRLGLAGSVPVKEPVDPLEQQIRNVINLVMECGEYKQREVSHRYRQNMYSFKAGEPYFDFQVLDGDQAQPPNGKYDYDDYYQFSYPGITYPSITYQCGIHRDLCTGTFRPYEREHLQRVLDYVQENLKCPAPDVS